MRTCLIVVAALFAADCGSSPATPIAPAVVVPACQSQNTATVSFQNRSTTNLTYDIVWDGSKLTTVAPARDSQVYTFAANITHTLRFQYTNTTLLACSASTPVLVTCANAFYSCTG